MLNISHQKFIRNITNVVQRIDKDLVDKLVTQDNKCFNSVCEKLESSCINTFNDIIKEKNDSADLIDAAVTIQKYYRGYKTRKEFNKKSKFLFLFLFLFLIIIILRQKNNYTSEIKRRRSFFRQRRRITTASRR